MTITTYPHAAALAGEAFAKAFPHIGYTVRPVQSEQAVDLTWTDGPTPSQVKEAVNPHLAPFRVRTYRYLSPDFQALLADDFEHWTGEPYDANRTYPFVFSEGRIVPNPHAVTPGDHLLRRLSHVTAVDGDRFVSHVAS